MKTKKQMVKAVLESLRNYDFINKLIEEMEEDEKKRQRRKIRLKPNFYENR